MYLNNSVSISTRQETVMYIREFRDDIGNLICRLWDFLCDQDGPLRLRKMRKKIPHLRKKAGGRERTGHRYAKVDALLRGLVTHSLPESVSRVGPGGCWRARPALYVGGPIVLQRELIVLFIIRSDKRFGGLDNKEEIPIRPKKKRKRTSLRRLRNLGIRRVFDSPAFESCTVILSRDDLAVFQRIFG